ncbi:tyrosine-type recombinase/integrase [Sinobaca sp. H24]|uniref:tyrosine-type recombinase/integrase n=1 Tax=Sinobaca sp. H24 TaxID=2923376 RepID=UPI00207AAECA|nr:tyrosine-type recombinase/integrase [Sinobaca sp. H24]
MAHEALLTEPTDVTLFLDYLASRGRKESTIRRYRYDLQDFYAFVSVELEEDRPPASKRITPSLLEGYFSLLAEGRHYHAKTIKRIHTVLLRYFSFLHSTQRIASNPMTGITAEEAVTESLQEKDLVFPAEVKKLFHSLRSDAGLSARQAAVRPMLAPRNLLMIQLFLQHGLRLQELSTLTYRQVNLGKGELAISEFTGNPRIVQLSAAEKKLFFQYFQLIPEPVRPSYPHHPVFVAFDFQRQTYRWSYENDAPKNLTEVAIQKMLREERRRAGIDRAFSAKHFRNTYIVNELKKGISPEHMKETLGLQSILTLNKYISFVNQADS